MKVRVARTTAWPCDWRLDSCGNAVCCLQVAVEGCCHGELDKIYAAMRHLEAKEGIKIDLLICCGDFQARQGRGGRWWRRTHSLLCVSRPPS
jgi:hypothetical protein